jgi:hypothetical protein
LFEWLAEVKASYYRSQTGTFGNNGAIAPSNYEYEMKDLIFI